MTRRKLIDRCLCYPDAFEDYPFDATADGPEGWAVIRHHGNRKSFALIYERDGLCVNLKCEPMRADFLRRMYTGITPAYHMNKTHWNTVRPDEIPEELLQELVDHSYRLTLPKKLR